MEISQGEKNNEGNGEILDMGEGENSIAGALGFISLQQKKQFSSHF